MKTEELIARLAAQAAPVHPLKAPVRRLATWFALALPAVVLVALSMGLRDDLSQRLAEPVFLLRISASLATAAAAALAGLALGVPGRSRAWGLAPLVPLGLWLASLGRQCLLEWGGHVQTELLAAPHLHCLPDIALMMGLPTIAMVVMVLRGAGLRRRMELLLGGLAAAALSNAALSFAHPVDAGLLVLLLQLAVVGGVAVTAGRDASLTPFR
ncbi:protein of unknown function [Magnetospirillum sp. XM-1]|uniref:NrsF family protein n=1 Tax=Magnetospirillum sp. XM-1 TaxID=1663591 RepID=UPI00073E0C98|nr:NrsF family protein [Magnetospirillum sp. XM-1]CUW40111.1 protein of unknown function [Magnetospirillum sp. XM-1]